MRRNRLLILLATAALTALAVTSGPVGAQVVPPGQGTSIGSSSLLKVSLGEGGQVLSLRLLGDDGTASIDKAVGTPEAVTALRPLSLSSTLVPALNTEVPAVEARSTGEEEKVETQTVSLASIASSGELSPASLTAIVDGAGARAGISSALNNLGVVGGLLSLEGVKASLGANAAPDSSDALRGIEVGKLTVLDLGALLEGLGIGLDELPLDVALDLLQQLGAAVGDLDPTDVSGVVDQINGAIDQAQGLLADVADQAGNAVCDTLGDPLDGLNDVVGGIGGAVGAPLPSVDCETVGDTVDEVTAQLNSLVDSLQAQLADLLNQVLGALAAEPLLTVDGAKLGLNTKAVSTVKDSVAEATGEIGDIHIGGLDLAGIDLLATADQVNALIDQVTGAVGDVLSLVDPGLADLVDVSVLDRQTDISQSGAYIRSVASLTAVKATITPPANLLDIVNGILGQTGVGELITGAGGQVPALETGMGQLTSALGGSTSSAAQLDGVTAAVGALVSGPSTVEVGSLSQSANFSPGVAPAAPSSPSSPTVGQPTTPDGQLPRTGGAPTLPAIAALGLAATALGIRRLIQRSQVPTT